MHKVLVDGKWVKCVTFNMYITAIRSAHFTTDITKAEVFEHLAFALKAARLLDGEVYRQVEGGGPNDYYKVDIVH